jgi:hypothetical protein
MLNPDYNTVISVVLFFYCDRTCGIRVRCPYFDIDLHLAQPHYIQGSTSAYLHMSNQRVQLQT